MTEDGVQYTKITDDGFGDPYNHGCRAFGITDDGLYVGTANPFYGTQVWKLSEKTDTQREPKETKMSKEAEQTKGSGNAAVWVIAGAAVAAAILAVWIKKRNRS